MVERVLDLSAARELELGTATAGQSNTLGYSREPPVYPEGFRWLATDRAADLQSGSPPSAGSLRTWEDLFAVTPVRPFAHSPIRASILP